VTDKAKTQEAGRSSTDEKRYPDPYGLYRRWFNASEDVGNEANEGTVSPEELATLWKRWFEAVAEPQRGVAEAKDGLLESMAPLWTEMAEDISAKMLSEETLPEDPLRFFLRWYNDTNERWSKAADELLREDETVESIGRSFETYARSYKQFRRVAEEGLKNLRVPTRSDVARVAKLVVVVENKVDRIEEAFEEFIYGGSSPATAGAVGNLEERMARLEDKMDRILVALENLEGSGGQDLPETSWGSTKEKVTDEVITPIEGMSLGLIEAGWYAGAGGRGSTEATKAKKED
jgi:polyhydroxyalkanoic acid synthase PhaR subunit